MLSDLRAVRKEADALEERERSAPRSAAVRSRATPDGSVSQIEGATTDADASAPTSSVKRTTSSAEYVVTEIKRHKRAAALALTVLVAVVAGVGFALYKYAVRGSDTPLIFQNAQVSRITTSGRATEANISPDGRYVVYVEDDAAGNSGILVRQTATGNTLQILPPARTALSGPAFSLDSDFVYYLARDLSSEVTSLYRVPSIGGTPKKVMADVDGHVAFSPDGKRFAFVREVRSVKTDVIVANSDGTAEKIIATRQGLDWLEDDGLAWSPDGRTIACAAGSSSAAVNGNLEYYLLGIDVETGAAKKLSSRTWGGDAGRVVWLPGGTGLALIASDDYTERNQIWHVSYPGGEASRVTNDVQGRDSRSLGVTADGRTLVTVTKQTRARIETVRAGADTGRAVPLTVGEDSREGIYGFAWASDGRIVYSSSEGGQWDLWRMDGGGRGRHRLTSDIYWDGNPAITPNGQYVVFASNRARGGMVASLWRMDMDGGNLTQLSSEEGTEPNVSPDGRWIIYSSWVPGPKGVTGQTMWKVSIDGGAPVQVTDYTVQAPAFSPDGNWIVGIVFDDQITPKRWRNAIIPASGGRPVKQFDRPNYTYQYVRWAPDGRHLSYIGHPAVPSNIWLQPVAGGEPRKLTDFKTDVIFRHAWSPDGKTLAVVRGSETTDVVLMKER